jgi:lysozyme family protein
MKDNFDKALLHVLREEGGFVNHPNDPGGATNKGITIAVYRKWVDKDATVDDLKKISDTTVAHIYRKHYWNAVAADDLPPGLDFAVFDFAVNSGVTRAIKFLQAILKVEQDGKIGPVTLKAANDGVADALVNQYCDRRLAFLKNLKTWAVFGRGWNKRVANVRSISLGMVAADHDTVGSQTGPVEVTHTVTPTTPVTVAPASNTSSNWLTRLLQLVASLFKGRKNEGSA